MKTKWKGHACFFCGVGLNRGNGSFDHLTPLSRGGSNCFTNKAYACRSCNEDKGSMTLSEYRKAEARRFFGDDSPTHIVRLTEPQRPRVMRMGVENPAQW